MPSSEKIPRSVAAPEFVLVALSARGRLDPRLIGSARRVKAHANPPALTGQVPGSIVLGPGGIYVVGADGVPAYTLETVVTDLTELRAQVSALVADAAARKIRANRTYIAPSISNATTAGKLKVAANFPYVINETAYAKSSGLDPIWDFTGVTALDGTHYQSFWLLIDSSGTGSLGAGALATSAPLAVAALPALDGTKSVVGLVTAAPSTNFTQALTGQSGFTITLGFPSAYTPTATTPAALETEIPS